MAEINNQAPQGDSKQQPAPPAQKPQIPQQQPQSPQSAQQKSQQQPQQTQQPVSQPPQPQTSATGPISQSAPPAKKSNAKKILIGGGAAFTFLIIVILALTFIFLGKPSSPDTRLAEALGVSLKVLVDSLKIIVRVFFLSLAFILFLTTMIAIFKVALAKKEDPSRKKSVFAATIAGVLLIVNLFLWGGSELYLYQKSLAIPSEIKRAAIETTPAQTVLTNLSAPMTVQFDATGAQEEVSKKGKVINLEWNFGDGTKDNGIIVKHEYKDKGKNQGVYKAVLNVLYKDNAGKELSFAYPPIDITITNLRPQGEIKADLEKGEAPLTVNFDASGFKDPDLDGKIVSYAWDFEGTADPREFKDSVNQITSHKFEKPGTYTVKLKITDDKNAETIAEKIITVEEARTPRAVIKLQAEANGKFIAGKQYLFDGSESTAPAGTIQKYEWNFGDETAKAQSKIVNHTFAKEGTYNITLALTDDKKQTGELSQKIEVVPSPRAPIAIIKTTPVKKDTDKILFGRVPFEVKFDAKSSTDADNNIIEYQWDFDGDGANDSFGPTASYTYTKEGSYTAALLVIDADNNESRATLAIEVKPAGIQAAVTATPVSGAVPLSVSFDASGSTYPNGKITSYEWNFGDGSPKRLDIAKLTYKYSKIGTFTASVTAIGADNSRDTMTVLVTIMEVPLKACFEATKHEGPAPLTVVFTSCSTGTIKEYKWDLNGDGNYDDAKGAQITHTFDNAGEYNVGLEISDNSGVTDSAKDTITVTVP